MLTCSVAVWLLTTSPKSPEELQRDLPSAVDETGQVAEAVTQIVTTVDLVGVFFFAISGAILAVRKGYDIVGSLLLALMVGTGGGVIRDLIANEVPEIMYRHDQLYATAAAAGAAAVYLLHPVLTPFQAQLAGALVVILLRWLSRRGWVRLPVRRLPGD